MDEERSNILVSGFWDNPYTKKQESFNFYIPKYIVNNTLPSFLKAAYDIDIKDISKFSNFLDDIGAELEDIGDIDSFVDLCLQSYYDSPEYEQDCKQELDEYEMLNNLGEYAPDFGEEDDVID